MTRITFICFSFAPKEGYNGERNRCFVAKKHVSRLAMNGSTVDKAARSVAFRDAHNFRCAFECTFGVAPSPYRGRFAIGSQS